MDGLNRTEFLNVTTVYTAASCTGLSLSKTIQFIKYSILLFVLLLANMQVVAVFYRNKALRTPLHYFIVNIAISDLIIPVITLPWRISDTYYDGLWLLDGVLGTALCKLVWISWGLSTVVSILSMVAIAADRFHAVLFPMKSALFSENKCRVVIAAIWVAAVASWAHYLYAAKLVTNGSGRYCGIQWEPALHMWNVVLRFPIILFCLTCLSAIVLTVLYSSIIIFLYRQKNNIHLANEATKTRAKENRKVTLTLIIIVLAFYIVYIPLNVVNFIYFVKPNFRLPCFFSWFEGSILPFLYPVINPVVYYVFKANYRQRFRELLVCPSFCKYNCNLQPPVLHQGENKVNNAEQMNNDMENNELREQ